MKRNQLRWSLLGSMILLIGVILVIDSTSDAASYSALSQTPSRTIPPFITLTPTITPTTTGLPLPIDNPSLGWPPDGGIVTTGCPDFRFRSATGAIHHYLYLADEHGYTVTRFFKVQVMYFKSTCENEPLAEGRYIWHVEGCRTGGCTYSETWSFTVDYDAVLTATPTDIPRTYPTRTPLPSRTPTPTHSATLRAPANGSTLTDAMPVFEFDAPSGKLYVFIGSPFVISGLQPCLSDTCPVSILLPAFADGRPREYQWYVVRCDDTDCYRISDVWHFTIPGDVPPTPS
jgi:hypothetical protein